MSKPLAQIPLDGSLRSYDAAAVSDGTATRTGAESVVQQQFVDEVDVNSIVRRFGMTREMPFGSAEGVFGDFTGLSDFDAVRAKVVDAEARFMRLPADVREKFGNDPANLIRATQTLSSAEFGALFKGPEEPVAPVVP